MSRLKGVTTMATIKERGSGKKIQVNLEMNTDDNCLIQIWRGEEGEANGPVLKETRRMDLFYKRSLQTL